MATGEYGDGSRRRRILAAMFDTVTVSGMLQILTPDVMLDLLSDKCGSAYEMYENLSWVRVAVICVVLALIFLAFFYLLSGPIERQW